MVFHLWRERWDVVWTSEVEPIQCGSTRVLEVEQGGPRAVSGFERAALARQFWEVAGEQHSKIHRQVYFENLDPAEHPAASRRLLQDVLSVLEGLPRVASRNPRLALASSMIRRLRTHADVREGSLRPRREQCGQVISST